MRRLHLKTGHVAAALLAGVLACVLAACTAVQSPQQPAPPAPQPSARPDRICPQIYLPVCAVRAGQLATYPNDCVAGAQGAQTLRQGPC